MSAATPLPRTVRPGTAPAPVAAGRTIDIHLYRNPVQLSLVAELDHPVSVDELGLLLAALQERHPVLGVAVEGAGTGPVFRTTGGVIPVEVAAGGIDWEDVVAAEQTRPIPPAPGPLARAVLVPRESGCAVVLTVVHQLIDGAGGPQTVLDLVTVLGAGEPAARPRPRHPARGAERWAPAR